MIDYYWHSDEHWRKRLFQEMCNRSCLLKWSVWQRKKADVYLKLADQVITFKHRKSTLNCKYNVGRQDLTVDSSKVHSLVNII